VTFGVKSKIGPNLLWGTEYLKGGCRCLMNEGGDCLGGDAFRWSCNVVLDA
jgi:hypothetical protein